MFESALSARMRVRLGTNNGSLESATSRVSWQTWYQSTKFKCPRVSMKSCQ
ncbi:hypothetical protein MTR67_039906 [Solanum verrucosum]|uniref:Uncharacterized protein n=1 Tax=Solanum verrucosum TaxID=315347 RepID=A0AAF0UJ42_SOLVR|nr:hypothetical protein MTR67_039906 [Solanum verrucosum]